MNERIDLLEILKDCPKGTKLYSILFGEVEFEGIHSGSRTVEYTTRTGRRFDVTREGKMFEDYDGECTLFPSKDQRDWSKFERFWDKPKRECFDPKTLQPFDRVLARYNKSCRWKALFFSHCYVTQDNENIYVCDSAEYMYCIPFDDNTKHLVGTKDEAPEYYRYWEN